MIFEFIVKAGAEFFAAFCSVLFVEREAVVQSFCETAARATGLMVDEATSAIVEDDVSHYAKR